jgi:uncharacterized repeat protein (TIGR01451 family)
MFRNALVATIFLACGLCSTALSLAQEPTTDGMGAQLADRLQKFRHNITGTAGPKGQARPAGQQQGKAGATTAPRRTTRPQPQQQPTYDPYAEDYDDAEFFPNTGIGEFFSNLTGRPPKDQPAQQAARPSTQPRAGSVARQQTAPSGRSARPTTGASNQGMAARTQNYAPAPTTRSAPRQAVAQESAEQPQSAEQRSLQDRLANSRRQAVNRGANPAAPPAPRVARRPVEADEDRATWTAAEQPAAETTPEVPAPAPRRAEPAVAETSTSNDDEVLFTKQSASLNVGTAGPKAVAIGKQATYRVVVQNPSSHAATAVVVSVRLPNWTEVVSNETTQGVATPSTTSPGLIEWQLAEIPARSQEELTLELIPRKSQAFDLAVGWSQQPQTAQATVEVQEPKLKIDIDGPSEVHYGENQVYKLTLSNPGNGSAENVMIHLLPIGQGTEPPAMHNVGTLAAGASQTLEIELTPRQAGELVIKAEATADGDLRCEAVEEVLVRRAGLASTVHGPKMQYAGTMATYEIQVTNPGNASAQDVVIAAELPAGAEFKEVTGAGRYNSDTGSVEWTLPQLQAGGEETMIIKCVLATPGVNNLNLTASASGELSSDAQTITRVEALADLVLDVSDPRGPVAVGQDVSYEVRISNRGTKSADGVEAIIFFSEGVEAITVEGGDHQVSTGQVDFKTIPTVPAGGEVIYTITARAETAGNHVFRAEVHCKSLGTSLASEETTKFYAEGAGLESSGVSPTPAGEEELSPTPAE